MLECGLAETLERFGVRPAGYVHLVRASRAVRLLGPTRVTNYQFLSPVVAVVVGALLLSEVIVPGQIVGGAIIGAGILVARGDGRRLLVRAARSVSAG